MVQTTYIVNSSISEDKTGTVIKNDNGKAYTLEEAISEASKCY